MGGVGAGIRPANMVFLRRKTATEHFGVMESFIEQVMILDL
jgi:hypothetical protein